MTIIFHQGVGCAGVVAASTAGHCKLNSSRTIPNYDNCNEDTAAECASAFSLKANNENKMNIDDEEMQVLGMIT